MAPPGADRDTRARGREIEARVAEHLRARGHSIVAINVELAHAELDIVARDDDASEPTIVFVEVRGRSDDVLGHPSETIDADKRGRIIRGATAWLVANELWERTAVRFDVITVLGPDPATATIEWLRGAFETR
ncbi:MAG: YraN family protein [Deltaproteobacteria bacterium]|nr:YraN family protein [Nannocystaceae bacterium]